MLDRQMADKCKKLAEGFPVLALLGPRQAGKTTLSKWAFPDDQYVTLEDLI